MNIVEKVDNRENDIVFVYTICGNIEEARSLGYSGIEEKLAISMDYWLIHSIYPWQNIVQEIDQYMLMFSTKKDLSDDLIKHIESEHSYKIPMVARCKVDMTNLPYSHWVENTLASEEKIVTEAEIEEEKGDINSLRNLK